MDQPPVGSIVIDNDGDAWQRHVDSTYGDHWFVALSNSFQHVARWDQLQAEYGPLKVVYTP